MTSEHSKGFAPAGGDCNTPLFTQSGTIQVHLDWFAATGTCSSIQSLLDYLEPTEECWAVDAYALHLGQYIFSHRALLPSGSRVHFNLRDDGRWQVWLNLSGSYLKALTTRRCWSVIWYLCHELCFKPTRVDIALDDYQRRIKPVQVIEALDAGNKCYFRNHKLISSKVNGVSSETIYLGSGRKMLRFYNAEVVHGIDADRWELQLREDKAYDFIEIYMMIHNTERYKNSDGTMDADRKTQDIERFLSNVVLGAVDFRDRSGYDGHNLDRCPRLSWWSALVDAVGSQRLPHRPVKPRTLRRTLDWLDKQLAPTLAMLRDGWGTEGFKAWLDSFLSAGSSRMGEYHQALAESMRRGFCPQQLC